MLCIKSLLEDLNCCKWNIILLSSWVIMGQLIHSWSLTHSLAHSFPPLFLLFFFLKKMIFVVAINRNWFFFFPYLWGFIGMEFCFVRMYVDGGGNNCQDESAGFSCWVHCHILHPLVTSTHNGIAGTTQNERETWEGFEIFSTRFLHVQMHILK